MPFSSRQSPQRIPLRSDPLQTISSSSYLELLLGRVVCCAWRYPDGQGALKNFCPSLLFWSLNGRYPAQWSSCKTVLMKFGSVLLHCTIPFIVSIQQWHVPRSSEPYWKMYPGGQHWNSMVMTRRRSVLSTDCRTSWVAIPDVLPAIALKEWLSLPWCSGTPCRRTVKSAAYFEKGSSWASAVAPCEMIWTVKTVLMTFPSLSYACL